MMAMHGVVPLAETQAMPSSEARRGMDPGWDNPFAGYLAAALSVTTEPVSTAATLHEPAGHDVQPYSYGKSPTHPQDTGYGQVSDGPYGVDLYSDPLPTQPADRYARGTGTSQESAGGDTAIHHADAGNEPGATSDTAVSTARHDPGTGSSARTEGQPSPGQQASRVQASVNDAGASVARTRDTAGTTGKAGVDKNGMTPKSSGTSAAATVTGAQTAALPRNGKTSEAGPEQSGADAAGRTGSTGRQAHLDPRTGASLPGKETANSRAAAIIAGKGTGADDAGTMAALANGAAGLAGGTGQAQAATGKKTDMATGKNGALGKAGQEAESVAGAAGTGAGGAGSAAGTVKVTVMDLRPGDADAGSGRRVQTRGQKDRSPQSDLDPDRTRRDVALAAPGPDNLRPTQFQALHEQVAGTDVNKKPETTPGQPASDTLLANLGSRLRDGAADIVRSAQVVLRDGNAGMIRLRLDPESLGGVKIELKMAEKHISGKIVVESEIAGEAFRSSLDALKDAFAEAGFETTALEVEVRGGHGEQLAQGRGERDGSGNETGPWWSSSLRQLDEAVPGLTGDGLWTGASGRLNVLA